MADCTRCSAVWERHKYSSYPKLPNLDLNLEKPGSYIVNPTAQPNHPMRASGGQFWKALDRASRQRERRYIKCVEGHLLDRSAEISDRCSDVSTVTHAPSYVSSSKLIYSGCWF